MDCDISWENSTIEKYSSLVIYIKDTYSNYLELDEILLEVILDDYIESSKITFEKEEYDEVLNELYYKYENKDFYGDL
jgi:archaellum component FlaG (FlaF/FlaG flagellin family)